MLVIIQARMSSRRLPGKVLMKIQGKTLIERVVEGVSRSKYVTKIIVATSKHKTDLPLRKLCLKKKSIIMLVVCTMLQVDFMKYQKISM